MNKDQIKGAIKADVGETQKDFGRLVGSESQEAKGLAREIEGKVQKQYGDAKEDAKDLVEDAHNHTRSTPM